MCGARFFQNLDRLAAKNGGKPGFEASWRTGENNDQANQGQTIAASAANNGQTSAALVRRAEALTGKDKHGWAAAFHRCRHEALRDVLGLVNKTRLSGRQGHVRRRFIDADTKRGKTLLGL